AGVESLERDPHDHDLRLRLQPRRSGPRYRVLRRDPLAAGRLPWSRLPDDFRQGPVGCDASLLAGVSAGPDERDQLRPTPSLRIMEPWRRLPIDRATSFRWRR